PPSVARDLPSQHSPSEFEPYRKLAGARPACLGAAHLLSDFAEIGVSQERIGCPETDRVGDIEELGPQLHLHSLSHREVLKKTHVNILDPLPTRVGGKPRSVARPLV